MQIVKDAKKVACEDPLDCLRDINELLHSGELNDSNLLKKLEKEMGLIHKLVIAAIQTIQNKGRLIYLTPRAVERIHITDLNGPKRLQNDSTGKKQCLKAGGSELLARIELNELQVGPRDMVICFTAAAEVYSESSIRYARKSGAMTACILLGEDAEEEIPANINVRMEAAEHLTAFERAWLQNLLIHLVSSAVSNYILHYELKEISF
ncbi:hypothetical protein [Domibacillus robiginosus]|uniref:hypothetical protein n=1 Tax=Domibacillus robiginosus TaxID=1071054 RepID=UPI000A89EE17|nr:hypothetical protein [Domibacillus robiginosus]